MTLEEARNLAVSRWIATYPTEERLLTFLAEIDPAMRQSVESGARAMEREAMTFLDQWPHQIRPNGHEQFDEALRHALKSHHPWVNEATLNTMRAYCAWYAWREGY